MKGAIVAAAWAAGVAASHNAHLGFHQRRGGDEYFASSAADVCTVYTTVYVYPSNLPTAVANSTVYVVPSPVPETSTSSSCTEEHASSVPAYTPAPLPSSSSEAAYTPAPAPSSSKAVVPPYSAPAYSAPVHSEAPAPSKPSSPKPSHSSPSYGHGTGSYSSTGHIITKGNKWAMTYTPYDTTGNCKTQSAVESDVAAIAAMGFTTLRTYSTDCGVFEHVVPAASAHGLKIIYGIFLEGGGAGGKGPFSAYANEQLGAITSQAPKDSVAMLIVGNESIFNGYTTAVELASYLDYVRQKMREAGFPSDIAVTTTEPVDVWQQQGKPLCAHIDVFTAQVHPYFTSTVPSSDAGKFAKSQLELAAEVCPEAAARGMYASETGWPHGGDDNGAAHATPEDQRIAIQSILEVMGTESCLFSFQDDKWKLPGPLAVEQNFGCGDIL